METASVEQARAGPAPLIRLLECPARAAWHLPAGSPACCLLVDERSGRILANPPALERGDWPLLCADGGDVVRGIFSLTQIAAELGIRLEVAGVASTFAEIERALAH